MHNKSVSVAIVGIVVFSFFSGCIGNEKSVTDPPIYPEEPPAEKICNRWIPITYVLDLNIKKNAEYPILYGNADIAVKNYAELSAPLISFYMMAFISIIKITVDGEEADYVTKSMNDGLTEWTITMPHNASLNAIHNIHVEYGGELIESTTNMVENSYDIVWYVGGLTLDTYVFRGMYYPSFNYYDDDQCIYPITVSISAPKTYTVIHSGDALGVENDLLFDAVWHD